MLQLAEPGGRLVVRVPRQRVVDVSGKQHPTRLIKPTVGKSPELLDVPGKFYLRARSQGLNRPRPARGFLATTAQVQQLAARHAHSSARLDPVSAQAAARHPAAHPRPDGDEPPPPAGGGHANPGPPGPGGWAAGEAADGDPEVARLLAVLANASPTGLTVTELVAATGRQKTWVYDRLADLQQVGLVKRAGQGHYHLAL